MVILPPLMEPENGKKEEGKATPAEEGKGDADEEREEASETGEMVENPFFNGLDEEGIIMIAKWTALLGNQKDSLLRGRQKTKKPKKRRKS